MDYHRTSGWLAALGLADVSEGKLISIASGKAERPESPPESNADSMADSEAAGNVPSLTSASSAPSSSHGAGVSLLHLSPPLQPLRIQQGRTQVQGPMRQQPSHQLPSPVVPASWQARTSCQSEQPMPEDPRSVTMNTIIDETHVPAFFARPGHFMFEPSEVKKRYVTETRAQHARLALCVENWRQKIPHVENGLLPVQRNGWLDFVQKARQGERERSLRTARDKKNMEDFIDGKVEGVHKTRFICWYVQITARAAEVWFNPKPKQVQRTESVEELNSIEDLVDI
ncbi:MAG: hypothetical protein Q9216_004448 [Gyalolechia sp. 2 TL-2023]